jgi:alginate O-acetyltransferase complex protein AlgI
VLFNSIEFLFVFLPLTVVGYRLLRQLGYDQLATIWLTLLSLGFYGWWNPPYVLLLLGSIAANYAFGRAINQAPPGSRSRRSLTLLGIGLNLALIGYYKYANFFLGTIDHVFGVDVTIAPIVLPLAISFFTFQQIAYLIDVDRGHAPPYTPISYTLFVTFFPQLIAGPIVHHQEMMPQFDRAATSPSSSPPSSATSQHLPKLSPKLSIRDAVEETADTPNKPNTPNTPNTLNNPRSHHLAVGLTIFTIGLIKKIWIADPIATISSPLFDAASTGQILTVIEAWSAALFYTFQLYFDFSGYSDMAIGAARLFGIVLPFNFDSPYKASSISDFWRRWHITLSNFLRDYLYIPLGGNRSGNPFLNLFITMLLGGLWHGAGWTFVVWGGLHGIYLGIDRAWRMVWRGWRDRPNVTAPIVQQTGFWFARCITFLAVTVSWVIFRADRLATAGSILRSMLPFQAHSFGELIPLHGVIAAALFIIVGLAPNLLEIMHRYEPALGFHTFHTQNRTTPPRWLTWNPKPWLGIPLGVLIFFALQTLLLAPESEFLYFKF